MLGIVSAGITAYYIMKRDGRGWHVHIFDFTMYCGLAGIVGASGTSSSLTGPTTTTT